MRFAFDFEAIQQQRELDEQVWKARLRARIAAAERR
jgi:hypothetical protein